MDKVESYFYSRFFGTRKPGEKVRLQFQVQVTSSYFSLKYAGGKMIVQ
jgi:hypothetical protein